MSADSVNALVMSGGGARGAFEVGVVDYLVRDRGLDFDVVTGVSVGALNAAMLAQAQDADELSEQLEALKDVYFGIRSYRDVFLKRGIARLLELPADLDHLLSGLGSNAIYDPTPLQRLIDRHLDVERLRQSPRTLRIGVVSLDRGDYRSVPGSDPDIKNFVLASTAIPWVFPPVVVRDERYIDGGTRNIAPLGDAFDGLAATDPDNTRPKRMFVVLSTPRHLPHIRGERDLLDLLERSVDIMMAGVTHHDLEHARQINEGLRAVRERGWDRRALLDRGLAWLADKVEAELVILEPDVPPVGLLDFTPDGLHDAFMAGRHVAAQVVDMGDIEK